MASNSPPPRTFEPTLQEILDTIGRATAVIRSTNSETVNPTSQLNPGPFACTLCTLIQSSVIRGIRSLFAEFVNDPAARNRLRAARGFCSEHARLVLATGDALGVAILYADLADQTVQRWRGRVNGPGWMKPRIAPCPACIMANEANLRYSSALAVGLAEEAVWKSIEAAPNICTAHAEAVAAAARRDIADRFLSLLASKIESLQQELNEIIRKNDYRFRHEDWGTERDAWIRAVEQLKGR